MINRKPTGYRTHHGEWYAIDQDRWTVKNAPDIADQRRPCPHCGAPMVASVPARDAEPTPEPKAR